MVVTFSSIGHPEANKAVAAAVEFGSASGTAVAAAIVGSSGELIAFLRAPGIPFHSEKIAQDKAFTAAGFRAPTSEVYDLVSGSDALSSGIAHQPRIVMFGGGLPIFLEGECIGGIGVSGGSEAFDTSCANAALDAIGAGGRA